MYVAYIPLIFSEFRLLDLLLPVSAEYICDIRNGEALETLDFLLVVIVQVLVNGAAKGKVPCRRNLQAADVDGRSTGEGNAGTS